MSRQYNEWFFSSQAEWNEIKTRGDYKVTDYLYPINNNRGTIRVIKSVAHDMCDPSREANNRWLKSVLALETGFNSAKKGGKKRRDEYLNALTRTELLALQTVGKIKSAAPYLNKRT